MYAETEIARSEKSMKTLFLFLPTACRQLFGRHYVLHIATAAAHKKHAGDHCLSGVSVRLFTVISEKSNVIGCIVKVIEIVKTFSRAYGNAGNGIVGNITVHTEI